MRFLFFILFLIFSFSSFSLVYKMSIEDLIFQADTIFYGKVEGFECYWQDKNIWTDLNFKVYEKIKGEIKEDFFKLKIIGGTVGEITQVVEDIPYFNLGEECILFLQKGEIVGAFQGKISIHNGLVQFGSQKYEVKKFIETLKKKLEDPNFQIFSSFINKKPTVLKYEGAKKAFHSNLTETTAKIFSAGWEAEVDYDGDGYKQFAKLYWDVDVSDRKSTLNVWEKIYWRASGDTGWVLLYATDVRTIKGNEPDGVSIGIEGANRGAYDFKIEVFREGMNVIDDYMDPSNNSELSNYKMELPEEDSMGSGSVIINISPDKASAGTDSEVLIRGISFEDSQGTGKVEFFYQYGEPLISAPINSWKNNEIKCEVPIGTINGYAATAGSGPVKVTTNSGIESNEYDFRVTFSYGKAKWSGTNPIVDYYIGENITSWIDAINKAGNTWSSEAYFTLSYAGTTPNTQSSRNSKNEIMFSKLGSNTIGQASYWFSGSKILECDLILNSSMKWSTDDKTPSGYYDVQTITLHEMGHWLNLRDLYGNYGDGEYDQGKVMYGFGYTGRNKRNLHPDDADGIYWIYGGEKAPESLFSWEPKIIYTGDEVSFYDLSKYNPSSWFWDFSDGDTSTIQNPKHTFYFSGIHKVKLRVSNSYGVSEITKNVVVIPKTKVPQINSPKNYSFIVPASAKAIGQNQTNWLTDLSIYNPNSENIYVYAYFLKSGEDNSNVVGIEILIGPLKMHKIQDLLYNLFSENNTFGALYFTSDKNIFITSRTYNDLGSTGTYGQFVPSINLNNLLESNEEGYILNLIQNENFRTNVGFANFSSTQSSFNVSFYKEGGSLIGTIPVTLKPYSHLQLLSPISQLTSEEIESSYAIVNQISPSSKIMGYASIVDNFSSDPIFVPLKKIKEIQGKKHQIVPVVARAKGAYGSNWRSDLKIFNPFQSQNIIFKLYASDGNTYEVQKSISSNSLVSYNDIISTLFSSNLENVSGSLHISSENGLFITSRTYNLVENKSYGQYIPGENEDNSIFQNETGLILHLTYNENYRCNIGFTDFAGTSAEVQVKLYDKNRALLAFKNYQISPNSNLQVINIFSDLNVNKYYESAFVEIKLLNGSKVYSYASVVDNRTGDSIFVPFLK